MNYIEAQRLTNELFPGNQVMCVDGDFVRFRGQWTWWNLSMLKVCAENFNRRYPTIARDRAA